MIQEEYSQANLEAAHDWEERHHKTWAELWKDATFWVTQAHPHYQLMRDIDVLRPFVCVSCGWGMPYGQLFNEGVIQDRSKLETVLCWRCREKERGRQFLTSLRRPTPDEQPELDDEAARMEERLA